MNKTTKSLSVFLCLAAAALAWTGCSSSDTSTDTPDSGTNAGDSGVHTDPSDDDDAGTQDNDSGTDAGVDASIDAPQVDLKFGNCDAFAACGGDPKGSWHVASGCVDEEAFDFAKDICAALKVSNVVFKAKGLVDVTATNIDRRTEVFFSATFGIPKPCADIVGGDCNSVATALKLPQYGNLDAATCKSDGANGCTCDVSDTEAQHIADTYTQNANTITTGSGQTYDICVDTGKSEVSYRETTAKALPATFVLAK